jgi:hypothetical protein
MRAVYAGANVTGWGRGSVDRRGLTGERWWFCLFAAGRTAPGHGSEETTSVLMSCEFVK